MESEAYTNELGTTTWTNRAGERHREDGPAVEHYDGSEEWYQRGVLHRVGGPAVYATEGFTAWYQHGQLHREDGPARQSAFEADEYWLRGQQLSADQWRAQFVQAIDEYPDRIPYVGKGSDDAIRARMLADLSNARPPSGAVRSPWKVTARPESRPRPHRFEPRGREGGLERD